MVTIDGDEVVSGSTIDGDEISEITIDGDVVWIAEIPIPDSAVYRWKLDDVNGTISDSVGSNNGSNNGITSTSGEWIGGSAGEGDGSSHIMFDTLPELTNIGSGTYSVAFTIQTTDNDVYVAGSRANESKDGRLIFGIGSPSGIDASGGRMGIKRARTDSPSSGQRLATTTEINDGQPHRVVFTSDGPFADDCMFYVDGEPGISSERNGDVDNGSGDLTVDFAMFGSNRDGSVSLEMDGILDEWIFFDDELTDSEVDDDYQRQPWS